MATKVGKKFMPYFPDRGDVIWISFNPQAGHEQTGRRPALIISPTAYNRKTKLAILCPITNKIKGYPFEVIIPKEKGLSGAVLADQVKNLDWRARKAEFICVLPETTVTEVLKKVGTLLAY